MSNPFETIDARLSNIENLLLDLKHTPKEIQNNELKQSAFIGFDKACEFLDVAPRTLKGYIAAGTIPNIKKEGKVYFELAELIEWLRSGKRKTTSEIAAAAKYHIKSCTKKSALNIAK